MKSFKQYINEAQDLNEFDRRILASYQSHETVGVYADDRDKTIKAIMSILKTNKDIKFNGKLKYYSSVEEISTNEFAAQTIKDIIKDNITVIINVDDNEDENKLLSLLGPIRKTNNFEGAVYCVFSKNRKISNPVRSHLSTQIK